MKGRPLALVPPPPPLPPPELGEGGLKTVTMALTGCEEALTSKVVSTVAVICAELMERIGRLDCVEPRFQRTCEPPDGSEVGRKEPPLIVRVKEGLPAAAELGEMEETVGNGFAAGLTTKVSVLERPLVPVPECGLSVLMKALPGFAMSAAATVAVMVVALTNVEGIVLPFHWTTVLATKPPLLLVTVRVKSLPPATAAEGEIKLMGAPVGF